MIHLYILLITLLGLIFSLISPHPVVAQTGLSILQITDNRQNYLSNIIPLYEKYEINFRITGTVATNLQFPYDAQNISGLANRIGITVDALFMPPGQTSWASALVQPAFYYQPLLYETNASGLTGWVYPQGEAFWQVRFAPKLKGVWQYKLRVQDDSICQGTHPCSQWIESSVYSFNVGESVSNNHGFVEVSPQDSRYFQMSDRSEFPGLGYQTDLMPLNRTEERLKNMKNTGVDLVRVWQTASLLYGRGTHDWDPWRWNGKSIGRSMRVGVTNGISGIPYSGHDFALKLTYDPVNLNNNFFANSGNYNISGGLEAGKNYVVRVRVKLDQVVPSVDGVAAKGFLAKLKSGATELVITPAGTGSSDWQILEGRFTNPFGRRTFASGVTILVGMQNVTNGTAYIDEVYIGENLGNGQVGANIVYKGQLNYHLYFDEIAFGVWDKVFELAKQNGVYVKPVILEKDDEILNSICLNTSTSPTSACYQQPPGTFVPVKFSGNGSFYAAPDSKVRRLQEYFWRYLAARWGYNPAIHSWELLNEGDPSSNLHREQANSLANFMHQWDRNHLVTTSFWHSFPTSYWSASTTDFADLHAYVSSSYAPLAEREKMQYDAAYFHIWHSQDVFTKAVGKPVVRGETGLDRAAIPDRNPELDLDTEGVWLHNFLWSLLDSGGLYEQYWWDADYKNHQDEFGRIRTFLTGLELSRGGYTDWGGTVTNNNLRVVGQKNPGRKVFHLWVQNKQHTWKNVVDGVNIPPQSGTVTFGGFQPGTTFQVERWDTWQGRAMTQLSVTADAQGQISLAITNLTSDVAFRVKPVIDNFPAGDLNFDGLINAADIKLFVGMYGQSAVSGQVVDVNNNAKIEMLDFAKLYL